MHKKENNYYTKLQFKYRIMNLRGVSIPVEKCANLALSD